MQLSHTDAMLLVGDTEEYRKIKAKKGAGISVEREEKRVLGYCYIYTYTYIVYIHISYMTALLLPLLCLD